MSARRWLIWRRLRRLYLGFRHPATPWWAKGLVILILIYGISPVEMARASIVGQPVHLLSPLVPSTYLLVALAGIEFGDHQRFTLKWAVLVCLCIMFAALLMGIFPLFSTL